jgi:hypothetical protein
MREYRYSVAEHDADRPWIVVGEIRHLTVEIADDQSFFDWAAGEWPAPGFEVTLDPWQLSPNGP